MAQRERVRAMNRIFKRTALPQRQGERGVTLIEILIVVAIMAIIAAVIIPNISAFRATGALAAANEEASNVKTAAIAYYANEGGWPGSSDQLTDLNLLSGGLRARYVFDGQGFIDDGTDATIDGGWGDAIQWSKGKQLWEKKP